MFHFSESGHNVDTQRRKALATLTTMLTANAKWCVRKYTYCDGLLHFITLLKRLLTAKDPLYTQCRSNNVIISNGKTTKNCPFHWLDLRQATHRVTWYLLYPSQEKHTNGNTSYARHLPALLALQWQVVCIHWFSNVLSQNYCLDVY